MAIIEANSSNFKELISTGSVIVQFHAGWCGPCKMITPQLEQFSQENENINIIRVDVEAERDLAIQHGIRGIPALNLMRNGDLLGQKNGFMPKQLISDWVYSTLEWRDR